MSRSVYIRDTVVLGGHDISDWVSRWALTGVVGELHLAEVDILTAPGTPLEISSGPPRVAIMGTDISNWVTGYREIVDVGKPNRVRLLLHADTEVLAITLLRGQK